MKLRNKVRDVRTIKTLLTGAEDEARRAGEGLPGAEHLLLSALALPDGTARRAFERAGADPDGLRAAIERQHADALRGIGIEPPELDAPDEPPEAGGPFRSTASARAAFRAASDMARANGGLLGAHVVAAVAAIEHGTAPRALAAMGVDRTALAAAAEDEAAA
jgi:hypothetical protein